MHVIVKTADEQEKVAIVAIVSKYESLKNRYKPYAAL